MKLRREVILLSLLFATLYFVQGFAEPSEGLIAQPVRAQLRFLQVPPSEISWYPSRNADRSVNPTSFLEDCRRRGNPFHFKNV